MMKCIICLEKKIMSEEHIIPFFLGGKLVTHDICADCNNRMGGSFEGRLSNSILLKGPAYINEIVTRSGKTPFPLAGTYTVNSKKIRVNNDGSCSLVSCEVDITETSTGLTINALIPPDKVNHQKEIISKKLERKIPSFKNESAEKKEFIINKITQGIVCSPVYTESISITTSQPISIHDFCLLFIKIAFLFASYKFKESYKNLDETSLLRESLKHCRLADPLLVTPFKRIEEIESIIDDQHHWIVICEHVMYIKIFSVTGVVIYAPNTFNQKKEHLYYRFCYKTGNIKKYKEMDLLLPPQKT